VGSLMGGVVALLVGSGLATAAVVGVVQASSSSNESSLPGGVTPQSQVLDYGTNQ
jgi:hypothetical protein